MEKGIDVFRNPVNCKNQITTNKILKYAFTKKCKFVCA